jgi:hypothetical protein
MTVSDDVSLANDDERRRYFYFLVRFDYFRGKVNYDA